MSLDANGLVHVPSPSSVPVTLTKLQAVLEGRGLKMFSLIDHSGEAEKVGLTMRSTKLLIFGSPKGGTLVMAAAPTVALDLPLKVLVWEDPEGKVWISYNSPEYLKQRHGIPEDLVKNISGVGALVEKAVE
ncbi:MAG: DUF302 domain-containing protein [Acidobacteriia bacterium]|nr:DUF302 domain-containing protein [Terriglobia bacterium]